MNRLISLLLLAAFLCACSAAQETPAVETDPRADGAKTTASAVQEKETAAPVSDALPDDPAQEPEPSSKAEADFSHRVIEAWDAAGCLKGMAPYSGEDLFDYYGIRLSECISGAGYADEVGYTTEAIVIEADEATAAEIESLLKDHLESLKLQFRDYDPDALKLAEDAVFLREGGVVLLIVSPDAQTMLELFRGVTP